MTAKRSKKGKKSKGPWRLTIYENGAYCVYEISRGGGRVTLHFHDADDAWEAHKALQKIGIRTECEGDSFVDIPSKDFGAALDVIDEDEIYSIVRGGKFVTRLDERPTQEKGASSKTSKRSDKHKKEPATTVFGRLYNWLANKLPEDRRDGNEWGFFAFMTIIASMFGILAGTALISNLAVGYEVVAAASILLLGVALGLAFSLATVMAGGGKATVLAAGLVYLLFLASTFGLTCLIAEIAIGTATVTPMFYIIIFAVIVGLAEAFFWLDKARPEEGTNRGFFTAWRKLVHLAESSVIVALAIGGCHLIRKGIPAVGAFLAEHGEAILHCVGWGTLIVLALAIYVKLNSLKYRKPGRKGKRRKGGR